MKRDQLEKEKKEMEEMEEIQRKEKEEQRMRDLEQQKLKELEEQIRKEQEEQRLRDLEEQLLREKEEQQRKEQREKYRKEQEENQRKLLEEQQRKEKELQEKFLKDLEEQRLRDLEEQRLKELEEQRLRELEQQLQKEKEEQQRKEQREKYRKEQEEKQRKLLEEQQRKEKELQEKLLKEKEDELKRQQEEQTRKENEDRNRNIESELFKLKQEKQHNNVLNELLQTEITYVKLLEFLHDTVAKECESGKSIPQFKQLNLANEKEEQKDQNKQQNQFDEDKLDLFGSETSDFFDDNNKREWTKSIENESDKEKINEYNINNDNKKKKRKKRKKKKQKQNDPETDNKNSDMEQKQEQDNDEEEEYEVEELVTTTQKKKKQSKDDFTLKLRRKKSEWVEDRQEQSKEFSHDLDGDEYMEPMHLRTVNSIFRDIGAEQSDDDDEEEMVTTIQKTKKKKKKQKIMDEFDDVKRPLRKYNSQVILPSKQPFDFASYKKKIVKKKKKKIIQDGTKDKQTIGSETSVKQENDSNFEFDDGSSEFSDADSLNEFSFPSRSPSQSREMSPGSQKRRDAQIKQLQEQLKNETNKGKSQYNLTNDDLKTIFGPTGIILSVHKPFLDELKRSIQENGGKDIGQVLMKLAGCLSCYKPYITSGLTQAQQRLQQKQKDNKKLDKLIQSIPSVEGSQQNNIDSLFVLPIQRLPRYKLLLQALIKSMEDKEGKLIKYDENDENKDDFDQFDINNDQNKIPAERNYEQIKQALDQICDIIQIANDQKHESEQKKALLDIFDRINKYRIDQREIILDQMIQQEKEKERNQPQKIQTKDESNYIDYLGTLKSRQLNKFNTNNQSFDMINDFSVIQLQDLYVEGDQQDEIQEDDEVLQFDPRAILTPSRRLIMEFAGIYANKIDENEFNNIMNLIQNENNIWDEVDQQSEITTQFPISNLYIKTTQDSITHFINLLTKKPVQIQNGNQTDNSIQNTNNLKLNILRSQIRRTRSDLQEKVANNQKSRMSDIPQGRRHSLQTTESYAKLLEQPDQNQQQKLIKEYQQHQQQQDQVKCQLSGSSPMLLYILNDALLVCETDSTNKSQNYLHFIEILPLYFIEDIFFTLPIDTETFQSTVQESNKFHSNLIEDQNQSNAIKLNFLQKLINKNDNNIVIPHAPPKQLEISKYKFLQQNQNNNQLQSQLQQSSNKQDKINNENDFNKIQLFGLLIFVRIDPAFKPSCPRVGVVTLNNNNNSQTFEQQYESTYFKQQKQQQQSQSQPNQQQDIISLTSYSDKVVLNPSGFTGQLMSKTDEEIQSMCLVGREYILQGTMHDIIQLEKQMKQAKDWKVIHTSQF